MNKPQEKPSKSGQKIYSNILNFIEAKNNDNSSELNKATFSTSFVRQLIRLYAPKNGVIYDSFMGTGTTAEGCIIENVNFIGSELSEKQCDFAEKRIGFKVAQPYLF